MEIKYTKGSKTLEELEALYDAEMKRREEQKRLDKIDMMELSGYFHTAKEMIDFVIQGGRIVEDLDGEWMQLKNGKVIHYEMFYNDIDMPLGMDYTSMTIEEFKDWANRCEVIQKRDNQPFVNDYFHKDFEIKD